VQYSDESLELCVEVEELEAKVAPLCGEGFIGLNQSSSSFMD
jgi:hypothetical protein